MFRKTGKFRRESQGNHPAALNTDKGWDDLYLSAMTFLPRRQAGLVRFFVIKKMNKQECETLPLRKVS